MTTLLLPFILIIRRFGLLPREDGRVERRAEVLGLPSAAREEDCHEIEFLWVVSVGHQIEICAVGPRSLMKERLEELSLRRCDGIAQNLPVPLDRGIDQPAGEGLCPLVLGRYRVGRAHRRTLTAARLR